MPVTGDEPAALNAGGEAGGTVAPSAEVDRLRAFVAKLGHVMGLQDLDLAALDIAASMVGVKGLPTLDIAQRPGPLTPEDRARMKDIADIWADFAGQLELLRELGVARLLETYTEHWDGGGRPAGLSGEDIPMGARILTLCYHYNGMISARPYRKALPAEHAVAELARMNGTVLDPGLVEAFVEMIRRERAGESAAPKTTEEKKTPKTATSKTNNPKRDNPKRNNPKTNNPKRDNPNRNNPKTNNPKRNNPNRNKPKTSNPKKKPLKKKTPPKKKTRQKKTPKKTPPKKKPLKKKPPKKRPPKKKTRQKKVAAKKKGAKKGGKARKKKH